MNEYEVSVPELNYDLAAGLPQQVNGATMQLVRERSLSPTQPVVSGTLLRYINGLLSEEDDPVEPQDTVVLVYFTPILHSKE